jgi:hypothetical protein
MRNESIELLNIAKELREYVVSLKLPIEKDKDGKDTGIWVDISKTVTVHYNPLYDYCNVKLSSWPRTVNVSLFETADYSNNTITINVESVDDVELEAIILLVQRDIAIFKAEKLIQDVHSSQVSL